MNRCPNCNRVMISVTRFSPITGRIETMYKSCECGVTTRGIRTLNPEEQERDVCPRCGNEYCTCNGY